MDDNAPEATGAAASRLPPCGPARRRPHTDRERSLQRWALEYLACPTTGHSLELRDEVVEHDRILSGRLVCPCGQAYPIQAGVPRFISSEGTQDTGSVASFGYQWDTLNFDAFRMNWLEHVVARNFGGPDYFRGKVILDCGAGSGMQSRWMLEAGARRVISLELSQAVDGVVRKNLTGCDDRSLVVQCDIARPPIRGGALDLVYCINVIQHTRDPQETTRSLYRLLCGRGEMVVNYYMRGERPGPAWRVREYLRTQVFKRLPKGVLLAVCRALAAVSMVPVLEWPLMKLVAVRGDVPKGPHYLRRKYRQTVLNTYDWHGSHEYQHYFTPRQLEALVREAGIALEKVPNFREVVEQPLPGQALRFLP
jgi:uncharacterized protein YbaR (Trm112 family)/2-polyprenyl-3-methyl-5-hydroxy-6-metoxy-1,4-benzoquinol methylase